MKIICQFLCLFFYLTCSASILKDRLQVVKKGDYVVLKQKKTLSLLSIYSLDEKSLILEEICLPEEKKPINWQEWLNNKAPHHNSWTLYWIDLQSNQLIDSYSVHQASWLALSKTDFLFSNFFDLSLSKLSSKQRKKIGPSPSSDELDLRRLWTPPMIVENKKISRPKYEVYQTTWMEDGSDLSNLPIQLYFDKKGEFFFPFWVEVQSTAAFLSVKAQDAGHGLISPVAFFPKRPPQFIGKINTDTSPIQLSIQCPLYFEHFSLYVLDQEQSWQKIIPIPFQANRKKDQVLELTVKSEDLQNNLQEGHRYRWIFMPKESKSYCQSNETFIWKTKSFY